MVGYRFNNYSFFHFLKIGGVKGLYIFFQSQIVVYDKFVRFYINYSEGSMNDYLVVNGIKEIKLKMHKS